MAPDVSVGSVVSAEIEIRGLSKWFGDHKVLKGVSTDVKRGEALVVIGPSGSGKTTLRPCIERLGHDNVASMHQSPGGFSGRRDPHRRRGHRLHGRSQWQAHSARRDGDR